MSLQLQASDFCHMQRGQLIHQENIRPTRQERPIESGCLHQGIARPPQPIVRIASTPPLQVPKKTDLLKSTNRPELFSRQLAVSRMSYKQCCRSRCAL